MIGEAVDPDGRALASTVGFVVGSRLLLYQAGFDPAPDARGAGTWLWQQLLVALPEVEELDLGAGGQEFKKLWATDERTMCRSRFGVGLVARTLVAAARVRTPDVPIESPGAPA